MLTLGTPADAKRLWRHLVQAFKEQESTTYVRYLTTSGAPAAAARIRWINLGNGSGIWSSFRQDNSRWLCWFGNGLGTTETERLVPAVEINLPIDNRLRAAGRMLRDEDGRLYLGHRGGLGGGRGGQTSMEEFSRRIRGFVREEFEVQGRKRPERAFIIAAADADDLIPRLHAYVSECVRLRSDIRDGRDGSPERGEDDGASEGYTPEHGEDGTGSGIGEHDIVRLHARVVDALEKLVPGARNKIWEEMRPDLYVVRGRVMETLFEVKAASDTQSWFTAIGQLVVYSGNSEPSPRRILVCPADRKHPAFRRALERLAIRLVTFEVDGEGGIRFFGLKRALART